MLDVFGFQKPHANSRSVRRTLFALAAALYVVTLTACGDSKRSNVRRPRLTNEGGHMQYFQGGEAAGAAGAVGTAAAGEPAAGSGPEPEVTVTPSEGVPLPPGSVAPPPPKVTSKEDTQKPKPVPPQSQTKAPQKTGERTPIAGMGDSKKKTNAPKPTTTGGGSPGVLSSGKTTTVETEAPKAKKDEAPVTKPMPVTSNSKDKAKTEKAKAETKVTAKDGAKKEQPKAEPLPKKEVPTNAELEKVLVKEVRVTKEKAWSRPTAQADTVAELREHFYDGGLERKMADILGRLESQEPARSDEFVIATKFKDDPISVFSGHPLVRGGLPRSIIAAEIFGQSPGQSGGDDAFLGCLARSRQDASRLRCLMVMDDGGKLRGFVVRLFQDSARTRQVLIGLELKGTSGSTTDNFGINTYETAEKKLRKLSESDFEANRNADFITYVIFGEGTSR